jgi:hypothetical protein
MTYRLPTALLASVMLLAPVSTMAQGQADARGEWLVTGQIDGKPFSANCDFRPQGTRLAGACTDIAKGDKAKPGKVHTISRGSVSGNSLRWTYPIKVMMMSIDINFSSTITGERMSGTIEAKGREGQFTAVRRAA